VHLHHLVLATRQHLAALTSPRHHSGNAGRALVTQSSDIGACDVMARFASNEVSDQSGAGGAAVQGSREPELPERVRSGSLGYPMTSATPVTAEASTGVANPAGEKLARPLGTTPLASAREAPDAESRVTR